MEGKKEGREKVGEKRRREEDKKSPWGTDFFGWLKLTKSYPKIMFLKMATAVAAIWSTNLFWKGQEDNIMGYECHFVLWIFFFF